MADEIVNSYPEQLPPGNPSQSMVPADGGNKWTDPVLGNYVTDPSAPVPRLRSNPRISHGSKAQPNFKAIPASKCM